jgi:hypothetical protein
LVLHNLGIYQVVKQVSSVAAAEAAAMTVIQMRLEDLVDKVAAVMVTQAKVLLIVQQQTLVAEAEAAAHRP